MPVEQAAKMREVADKIGNARSLGAVGWAEFNNSDKSRVERTFSRKSGRTPNREAFGAETVLLVPCRIGAGPVDVAEGERRGRRCACRGRGNSRSSSTRRTAI
jgi:hypothetical protein